MSAKSPTVIDPRFAQPGHPPATIDEFEGVRFLHLGTSWVQGAMRLATPSGARRAICLGTSSPTISDR